MSATLSTVIDDENQNFDTKVGSDNINESRIARDNRQGMACHAEEITYINFALDTECERANDAT